ncbi:MAG: DMT family protein [Planctomycetes bacterium]|nr:DMT family protein [Planctomycetota bacterium]
MPVLLQTIFLLTLSNVFMTFAWYGHLGSLKDKAWYLAVSVSWGIAFFEYLLQVPANRIGNSRYSLAELKILQEVISLSVFVPIAAYYLKQPWKWDYLWASLCIVGAVFFIFRERAFTEEPPPVLAPQVVPVEDGNSP